MDPKTNTLPVAPVSAAKQPNSEVEDFNALARYIADREAKREDMRAMHESASHESKEEIARKRELTHVSTPGTRGPAGPAGQPIDHDGYSNRFDEAVHKAEGMLTSAYQSVKQGLAGVLASPEPFKEASSDDRYKHRFGSDPLAGTQNVALVDESIPSSKTDPANHGSSGSASLGRSAGAEATTGAGTSPLESALRAIESGIEAGIDAIFGDGRSKDPSLQAKAPGIQTDSDFSYWSRSNSLEESIQDASDRAEKAAARDEDQLPHSAIVEEFGLAPDRPLKQQVKEWRQREEAGRARAAEGR
jgi:hypothetical protein